jgi:multiple sugar transport system substrate-binding protein
VTARPVTASLLAALLVALLAAACGTEDEGAARELQWYVNPDDGGQAEIAARCTEKAAGRYRIATALLPRSASDQREQLLRRLAAEDSSIDLMSLDVVFVPEFAEAGFLAPIPEGEASELTDGVVEPAVRAATWQGRLVAVPMWANTQLLWYRKSVVRRAGIDLSKPMTWDRIIDAARATDTTVAVQAQRYEGYTVLVNALIESAGGHIIENPGANADELELGIDTPAGEAATDVLGELGSGGVGGPSISTADEEAARTLFQGPSGGFMVNWPYVWRAANAAVEEGSLSADVLADIGFTRYPRVQPDAASRPPLGGIDIGIGAWSRHPDLALEAARCITSLENQTAYFLREGNPAARAEVFSAPSVVEAFPMAALLRTSLEGAAPRPQTDVYGDLSAGVQHTFHPPDTVGPETPSEATTFISEVLEGERLL